MDSILWISFLAVCNFIWKIKGTPTLDLGTGNTVVPDDGRQISGTTTTCFSSTPTFIWKLVSEDGRSSLSQLQGGSVGAISEGSCGGGSSLYSGSVSVSYGTVNPAVFGQTVRIRLTINNNPQISTTSTGTLSFIVYYNLTGSSPAATLGQQFTWTCHRKPNPNDTVPGVKFYRNEKDVGGVAEISGCQLADTNTRYSFGCTSETEYTLTIPSQNMTEYEQNSVWRCGFYDRQTAYSSVQKRLIIAIDVSSVTLEPRDNPLTLMEGSDREVRCTVNSNAFPTPTYAWFIDTRDITSTAGSDTSSVSITGSKADNGKVLRCQATNNNRPKNGNTVLNITYEPTTSVTPSSPYQIREGDTAVISCVVTDANPNTGITWSWTKTGNPAVSYTGQNYTIPNIKRSQRGTYQCTATNSIETSVPATVQVDVQYPPTVSPLKNRDVIEGSDLAITCSVTNGKPSQTTVYWTKSGDSGFRQNNATLQITKINRSSSGSYTCTAENIYTIGGKGTGSQAVNVNVLYPPTVSPLTNRDVIEGSDLTITCSVTNGNPSQTTVYWTKSGDSGFRQNNATLQITKINRSSSGTYTCTAENIYTIDEKGTGSQAVNVNVLYPPTIQDGSTITVNESQRAILTRNISSNPASNMSWYSRGVLIHTQTSVNTAELKIENTECTDTGNYTLNVSNGITHDDSAQVELLVNCKPETKGNITLGITDTIGIEFSTTLIAYPQPRHTLYYENKTVSEKMTSRLSRNAVNNFTITYNKTSVQQNDYGVYLLEITNSFGISDIYINIIPQRKPNAPEVISVLCNVERAEVTWKSSFNGGAAQTFTAIAMVDGNQEVSHSSSVVDKGVDQEHQANVGGLQPSVTYFFNVSASNIHGETLSTNWASCKTRDEETNLAAVVGGAAAGGVGLAVIAIILVIFLRRYKIQGKHAGKTQRLNPEDDSEDDDGLKVNALYVSADIVNDEKPGPSETAVYAEVNKRGPESDSNANVYAEVKKTGKKGGEDKATNGAVKPKKGFLKKKKSLNRRKVKSRNSNKKYQMYMKILRTLQ
ncbi:titin-like isoform X2 [Ostrea edulis]|uniref:titin-like isoform X2 n=1 Tax=Ostrea edulis TaxID=37623 RepID=UPI0024AF17F1|nr:titin-like isoform X2 [Ostrea edulis]